MLRMESSFNLSTRDPVEFETVMAPIVGHLSARPVKTAMFNAKVSVKRLSKLSIFTVRADSIRVDIEPPHRYVGLQLPLGRQLTITENSQEARFLHDIHLQKPGRELSLEFSKGCRALVANLFSVPLQDYVLKLTAADESSDPTFGNRISISSPSGLLLSRSLAKLWTELRQAESSRDSSFGIMETEDALIARFVMASHTRDDNNRHCERVGNSPALARAEEYLNANLTTPVSQADLAAYTGVSIRTLSRAFSRRHGIGPIGYLRAQRLDAAYRDLLGADADSTTVTEVASRYGFVHFGKFSIEYKQAFGESPSVTLRG